MSFIPGTGSESELIKMLIDKSPIAYIIIDKDYYIRYANESFAKLFGMDVEDMNGDRCYNIANNGAHCRDCAVARVLDTLEKPSSPARTSCRTAPRATSTTTPSRSGRTAG